MKYGERLRHARNIKKWSQDRLAEKSGVKQGSISKIERGDQEYSAYDIALSEALGINSLWLATGKGEMYPIEDKVRCLPAETIDFLKIWEKLRPEHKAAIVALSKSLIGITNNPTMPNSN